MLFFISLITIANPNKAIRNLIKAQKHSAIHKLIGMLVKSQTHFSKS